MKYKIRITSYYNGEEYVRRRWRKWWIFTWTERNAKKPCIENNKGEVWYYWDVSFFNGEDLI